MARERLAHHYIPFVWRRVHSFLGLWLVLYLIVHLLVNSQAALWIGDDGHGFVRLVNKIKELPYLQVIELTLLGVPFLIHGIWGIQRLRTAKLNSMHSDGSTPSLNYGRNHAFTWQRVTSWILLFGVVAHVIQMRFLENPVKAYINHEKRFLMKVYYDQGLETLTPRLGAKLYPELESYVLKKNQVIISAPNPGVAILFMVRDTFKSPLMIILYTVFVLAAAFHAFNGVWTFLITWGIILSYPSQRSMVKVNFFGMALLSFLGLAAIWGTYYNLKS